MKPITAIKTFLEDGPNGRPTSSSDLVQLKKGTTPEEWKKFGQDAAAALGEELDGPA